MWQVRLWIGVARPIARRLSARNRTDIPFADTMISSPPSSTNRAETNSSPSLRLMAINPPVRLVSYSVRAVFFTRPCLVPSTR